MNVLDFKLKKDQNDKISMITCYDYSSARIANGSTIDGILVGDSVAMTMYGERSTLPAHVGMIAEHTRAVVRGAPEKFIISDMPFLSFRQDLATNMKNVLALMQSGAQAVKIEGADGNLDLIRHIVDSGVPVMGHLGLTPQSVHQLGGYKVQGRATDQAKKIMVDAKNLEESGCFALVLECVPSSLAQAITKNLSIPTIGIGAGLDTDGQILVWQDLLGMNLDFKPKFVRSYLNAANLITEALSLYTKDVKNRKFPNVEESFE